MYGIHSNIPACFFRIDNPIALNQVCIKRIGISDNRIPVLLFFSLSVCTMVYTTIKPAWTEYNAYDPGTHRHLPIGTPSDPPSSTQLSQQAAQPTNPSIW